MLAQAVWGRRTSATRNSKGDPVKVGFIGTGDEGNMLLTSIPPKYMDIVAVADLRPHNRDRAFKGDGNDDRIGLIASWAPRRPRRSKRFKDHKELLANAKELGIEAVVIATPLNTHAPIAIEAMDAGLHVLTEKLMAHTVTECKEMIRKAKEKNLLLAVGHQRHYSVLYDNANRLVQNGLLGDIKLHPRPVAPQQQLPEQRQWRNSIPEADKARRSGARQDDQGIRLRLARRSSSTGGCTTRPAAA